MFLRSETVFARGIGDNHAQHRSPEGCPFSFLLLPRTAEHDQERDGCPPGLLSFVLPVTCRDCGLRMEVTKTMSSAARTTRINQCPCGSRFETEERVTRRLPVATGRPPVVTGNPTSLDLISSLSDPISLSDSALTSKPPESDAGARKSKGRPNLKGYTEAFEAFWQGCNDAGRGKGNKWPAFKAFDRLKLDPIKTFETWNLWMTTPQWSGGHNPDVSSWLNARGFEGRPTAANLRPGAGAERGPTNRTLDLRP